jgi:hypothetical protein
MVGVTSALSGCGGTYDSDRLGEPVGSGAGAGGGGGGGGQSGTSGMAGDGGLGTGDGGTCMQQAETCNLLDDDCDGDTDEDTVEACQEIVLNADTECVVSRGVARCLKIRCLDGFSDRDGDPTNGCETALDDGDGGTDDDAGS